MAEITHHIINEENSAMVASVTYQTISPREIMLDFSLGKVTVLPLRNNAAIVLGNFRQAGISPRVGTAIKADGNSQRELGTIVVEK